MLAWLVCISTRLLFCAAAYVAYWHPPWLQALGALALIPACGFLLIWLFGWRKTGFEVMAPDHVVWWNALRPVHAALYAAFAVLALSNCRFAYLVLLADVVLGIVSRAYTLRHSD